MMHDVISPVAIVQTERTVAPWSKEAFDALQDGTVNWGQVIGLDVRHMKALAIQMVQRKISLTAIEKFGIYGMEPYLNEAIIAYRQNIVQSIRSLKNPLHVMSQEELERELRGLDLFGFITNIMDGVECGSEAAFSLFTADPKETYDNCQAENERQRVGIIIGICVGVALCCALCIGVGICLCKFGLKAGGEVHLSDLAMGPQYAAAQAAKRALFKPKAATPPPKS